MARARQFILRAFVSITILVLCFVLFSSSLIWRIYIYGRLKILLQQYGFAKIPPSELPFGVEYTDNVVLVFSSIWFLSILIGLFYSFSQLYQISDAILKKKMHYSYRMTVVAMVIPFYNLYRPWVGLSEIRRALTSRRSARMAQRDYITIVFAGCFLASLLLIIRTQSYVSLIVKSTEAYAGGLFDALITMEFLGVSLVAFATLITFAYCYSAISAANDLVSKTSG